MAVVSNTSQEPANIECRAASSGVDSPPFAPIRSNPVTPGLQSGSALVVPQERLLSVREVAARLGVCTSTVYRLCAEGRLVHVRVANAIRIAPADLGAPLALRHHTT
ncbi:MAG TPA: helix-turn-helix domain-containing protein [Anaeromyxobacteraceae bacterium]|nr:helix-turn-helix domain-containing protein [Anaeromyxobacteraceae bacterium]